LPDFVWRFVTDIDPSNERGVRIGDDDLADHVGSAVGKDALEFRLRSS
jgi:hypothetical protein